ncbi:hypothetical protein N9W41_00050, partial [bacterium]|nr:hypothetical protein [bacterium]
QITDEIILAKKVEKPMAPEKDEVIEEAIEADEAENLDPETEPESVKETKVVQAAPPKQPDSTPVKVEEKSAVTGFVYRVKVTSPDPVQDNNVINDILLKNGAAKAGKVKLGWQKPDGSYYYHFQVSEASFKIIKEKLSESYKVNLIKYAHKRVMPEGLIRAILTVN